GLDGVIAELRRLRTGSPPESPAVGLAESLLTDHFPGTDRLSNPPSGPCEASTPLSTSSVLKDGSDFSTKADFHFYRSVARIRVRAAGARAHAHGQRVLPRDIKPSTFLLDARRTVWVTDFGLAKEEGDDLTRMGNIVGTLRYMAPERFNDVS